MAVVTRSSLIASDLMVLCITWLRTYETAKLSFHGLGKRTFASILLLDGVSESHYSSLASSIEALYHMIPGTIYFV